MFRSLQAKIAMLAVVPIFGVLGFATISVYEKYIEYNHFNKMRPLIKLADVGARIIHEIQKERGKSVGLLNMSYSQKQMASVAKQRLLTDNSIKQFDELLASLEIKDDHLTKELDGVSKAVHKIDDIRKKIDTKNFDVKAVVNNYTIEVDALLHMLGIITEASPSPEITSELMPFFALVEAKEAGGLERALGSAMLNQVKTGNVNFETYLAYSSKLGGEKAYISEFKKIAKKQQLTFFNKTVSGDAIQKVQNWRKVLAHLPITNDGKGIEPNVWFNTATKRLDMIKKVSEKFIGNAEQAADRDMQNLLQQINALVSIAIAALVATMLITYFQIRSIFQMLDIQRNAITSLANGEMDVEIQYNERKDIIGDISRAMHIFLENMKQRNRLEKTSQQEQERERQRQKRLVAIIEKFKNNIKSTIDDANAHSSDMRNAAARMSSLVVETAGGAISAGEQSNEASTNVQTVASATEELSASVQGIAEQTLRSNELVTMAAKTASETDHEVGSLLDSVQEISTITELIQDIAEQTNLLALNATIESARAGEAGKGFAVVASEVKTLADQTGAATQKITDQIGEILNSTEKAVASVKNITTCVAEIEGVTTSISKSVDEQDAATKEISESLLLASRGTDSAAEIVSEVNGKIDETSNEVLTVDENSKQLSKIIKEITTDINQFINDVASDDDKDPKAA